MANRLIHEQSPYLLQHAHNPVDWYPWGDEPFERAKRENKPLIVSIGYAACHWCHVMERESFEDEQVAAFMNEHFINIKVDREEHPDVDHLYMDAVQAINGNGGWPLNVFVTPERVPFYGGTYYPPRPAYSRPSWLQLLERMRQVWDTQQDEVKRQTDQMLQFLQQSAKVAFSDAGTSIVHFDTTRQMALQLLKQADKQYGGFGTAPKFPATMSIRFLLEHFHYTGDVDARDHALHSLDAMIFGGIYDQLGGGLARYATDAAWLVPHFEKMLYDNALIVMALCDAYRLTKERRYATAIEEIIAFVNRELCSDSGIYYSALDADSEGVEGKFYTWSWEEWQEVVDDPTVAAYFGVSQEGNWEHTNILHVAGDINAIAQDAGVSVAALEQRIKNVKSKLFAARSNRIRPLTDDKSLLSWNALMSLAISNAAIALQRPDLGELAEAHMKELLRCFEAEDGLKHVWKGGVAKINAHLDDYAFLIQALLHLASLGNQDRWIVKAAALCETVVAQFSAEDGSFFYFSSAAQNEIPVRKVDVYDGAAPSGNAVMAHNLLLLGMCMERSEWMERANYLISQMGAPAQRYTTSFSYWSILLQRCAAGLKTVLCVGPEGASNARMLHQEFLPHCYFLTSQKEISEVPILKEKHFLSQSLIFVCTQQACLAPVNSVAESLQLISAY